MKCRQYHRHGLPLFALALIATAPSCVDSASPPGPSLAVTVAPLALAGITNASYRLEVFNADGAAIVDVEIDADRHGDGAGSVSYVAPCDADANDNRVDLTLLALSDAAGTVDPATYVNPGTLSRTATCLEGRDVAVDFDITIARAATQGFFDVAVQFDDLFCSAKLDCLQDAADPSSTIDLLFNASGERDRTFVLGFACAAGATADVETWQYLDDVVVACDEGTVGVNPSAGPGVLPASAITQISGATNPLFAAAVFQGAEQITGYDKQYWNVALGFTGGTNCALTARAAVADGPLSGNSTPVGAVRPYLVWDVPLTDAVGAQVCTQHPVDADTCPTSGVCTTYTGLDAAETFAHPYNAAALPLGSAAVNPAASCMEILTAEPASPSGVYWVDPPGGTQSAPFEIYCDMETDDGGWALVAVNGRNYDTVMLTTAMGDPAQIRAVDPGAEVIHKLDDTTLNALKTATGTSAGIRLVMASEPGAGRFKYGRGACVWESNSLDPASADCDYTTGTYATTPSWTGPTTFYWFCGGLPCIGQGLNDGATCTNSLRWQRMGIYSSNYSAGNSMYHVGGCTPYQYSWGMLWVR